MLALEGHSSASDRYTITIPCGSLLCTRVHVEHVPFYRLMLPQGLWPLTVFPHEISVFISAIVSNNFMPRKLLLGQLAGL